MMHYPEQLYSRQKIANDLVGSNSFMHMQKDDTKLFKKENLKIKVKSVWICINFTNIYWSTYN